jgi:hypothetical protein
MPLAKSSDQDAAPSSADDVKRLQAELDRLHGLGADEPEKIRKELEDLRRAKREIIKERIMPRILQIDNKDGKLYAQEADGRVEVDADKAREMVREDRRRFGQKEEIVYVVQYPSVPTRLRNHPNDDDKETYGKLFPDAALIYEMPR